MRMIMLLLLMLSANQAAAWWNVPYGSAYQRGGYWPNAWPAYAQPSYNMMPYQQNNGGWNVRGTMNPSGDMHFIMEYHGNVYDDFYGRGHYGFPYQPGYRARWR